MTKRISMLLAGLVALLLALTACSASGEERTIRDLGGDGSVAADRGAPAQGQGLVPEQAGEPAQASPDLQAPKVVRRASLTVIVDDVAQGAASIRAKAAALGGQVVSEELDSGVEDPEGIMPRVQHGSIVVEVPAAELDAALDELAGVGEVVNRSSSLQDVTAQHADLAARVEALETSIERIRGFLAEATDMSQVVALEAELSSREADLASLRGQAEALDGRIEMSPVAIDLVTDPALAEPEEPNPFLEGLEQGWENFQASVGWGLSALGALLPFALALALVTAPLWWSRRRLVARGRRRPAAKAVAEQAKSSTEES